MRSSSFEGREGPLEKYASFQEIYVSVVEGGQKTTRICLSAIDLTRSVTANKKILLTTRGRELY